MQLNSAIASLVVFIIACIHLYWSLGGKKGLLASVPTENGKPLFVPGKLMTFGMAVVLAEAGCVLIGIAFPALRILNLELHRILSLFFGAIFMARAIGGLLIFTALPAFRNTAFSRWDRYLYSPICLYLGLSFLWVWYG